MSLLAKIIGDEQPEVAGHHFWAGLVEWTSGKITKTELMSGLQLTPATSDETELDFVKTKYDASVNKERFLEYIHELTMLAEGRLFGYDDKSTLQDRINEIP